MGGYEAANLQRLAAVVGTEDVVDDEDLLLVQRPDPHALAAARGQGVGPVERPGPQLVGVEIAGADVQQGATKLVLARVAVLLDEADVLQRPQDPVNGALWQPELPSQLDHPESARAPGQQPQNGGGALDGLDRSGHLLPSQARFAWSPATLRTKFDIGERFPLLSQRTLVGEGDRLEGEMLAGIFSAEGDHAARSRFSRKPVGRSGVRSGCVL